MTLRFNLRTLLIVVALGPPALGFSALLAPENPLVSHFHARLVGGVLPHRHFAAGTPIWLDDSRVACRVRHCDLRRTAVDGLQP